MCGVMDIRKVGRVLIRVVVVVVVIVDFVVVRPVGMREQGVVRGGNSDGGRQGMWADAELHVDVDALAIIGGEGS